MSDEKRTVTSEAEFRTELEQLLNQAKEHDVEVRGGWECLNGGDKPNWDVVITEVTKNRQND